MMDIVLIAAVADNGVIGAGGGIPWRLKHDLKRFKAMTIGRPVVMGRRTYQSLPRRPLSGRTNIVLTRDVDFRAEGAVVTTSRETAVLIARGDAMRRGVTEIAVIGGADIYAGFMAGADRLEITEVHLRPVGDTCFPAIDPDSWQETARQRHLPGPGDSAAYSYVTYRRRRPP